MNLITPDFGLIFWQTVTLLVVMLVLKKFAWTPILKAIQKREENIEAALKAAELARRTVEETQRDQEALLKIAHTERTKIIETAIATQHTIIDKAKIEAEEVSKSMIEQTRALLAKEREAALREIKNMVATFSIQIAGELLQDELKDRHTQEALVRRLIQEAYVTTGIKSGY